MIFLLILMLLVGKMVYISQTFENQKIRQIFTVKKSLKGFKSENQLSNCSQIIKVRISSQITSLKSLAGEKHYSLFWRKGKG
jgi:glutaredoxin 2